MELVLSLLQHISTGVSAISKHKVSACAASIPSSLFFPLFRAYYCLDGTCLALLYQTTAQNKGSGGAGLIDMGM